MHTRFRHVTVLAALLPLAAVAACGAQTVSVGGTPVTGVRWNVESVTVDGTRTPAPQSAYVEFPSADRARGNNGCNHFDAEAEIAGGTIRVGQSNVTMMWCEEKEQRDFEKTFARAIGGTSKARTDGDRLTLTTDDGDTIALVKERPAPLTGTEWTVTSLLSGDVAASLPEEAAGRARFTFGKDGVATGSLGCNRFRAKAEIRDGHLTLGRPATTRMLCQGPRMDTERALLKLFGQKLSYEIRGRTLTLTAPDGAGLAAGAGRG
ncbi:META domain-containing protein [Streptomyces antnestii]|uniref:META domain-containing protein n=1 Tax=Streptomyces antnestii TaxID=2494256 RepID=A0A437PXZ4_9ACTN|nr:META domain-containing protein [Streptomyces sp. San01]RVU27131.1 META domain-containing protein [Streptomyces sp. San01]